MPNNDVYQLTVKMRFYEKEVVNVYHYQADSDLSFAEGLIQGWGDNVLDVQLPIMSEAVFVTGFECFNLFDPTDFAAAEVSNIRGLALAVDVGAVLPPFVAWSFKTPRLRRDMRAGFKRIPGIAEGMIQQRSYDPTWLDAEQKLDNFAAAISVRLFGSVTGQYDPVIVKRIREEEPETGRVVYRLPEFLSEATMYPATGWSFQEVTSQNSRKV